MELLIISDKNLENMLRKLTAADERKKSDDDLRIAGRKFNYNIIEDCRIKFQYFEKRIIRKMIAEKFFKSKLNVIAVKSKYYYD
jgi:hypothetical protein